VNILFLITNFPCSGGMETVTRILSNAFVEKGHNVGVAYFHKTALQAEVNPAVKQFVFPVKSKILIKDNIDFLRNILVEDKINVVINQMSNSIEGTKLIIKARDDNRKYLITCWHGTFLMDFKNAFLPQRRKHKFIPYCVYLYLKEYFYFRTLSKVYYLSDKMVYLSNEYVKEIKQKYPNKKMDKLTVIPNPLLEMPETQIDYLQKKKKLLFVGRMAEHHKRMSLILKSWKIICNKYHDWDLVFVGDGENLGETKELAKNLPRVQFEGFREPKEYYEKSSIFLMTSAFEGLPMTLIESQSFGCVPVVMNSFASLPDIIQNGKNGFIVPNNDINAFAEKVCLLMDNAQPRKKMAENGMESVKKFSIENIVNEWEKLFVCSNVLRKGE
jgi:glycosyltransferase involved in cell wall biosynthesis